MYVKQELIRDHHMSPGIFTMSSMLLGLLLPLALVNVQSFVVINNPFFRKHSYTSQDFIPLEHGSTANRFSPEYYQDDDNKQTYMNYKRLTNNMDNLHKNNSSPQSHCRCTCVLKPNPWHDMARTGHRRKDGPSEKKWLEVINGQVNKLNEKFIVSEALRKPAESLKPSSIIINSKMTSRPDKILTKNNNEVYSEDNEGHALMSYKPSDEHLHHLKQVNETTDVNDMIGHTDDIEKYATSLDFSSLLKNSDVMDRYADHWEGTSRYPYRHLRNDVCYRQPCKRDKDCCLHFNLCDKSAFICIDCWYGQNCQSEKDCCLRFPICSRRPSKPSDSSAVSEPLIVSAVEGRCVDKLPKSDSDSH